MVRLSYIGLALLLDVSLKSLLLALLAGAVLLVLRVRNTNVRHRVWTGVLLGMLVLPLAVPLTPGVPLPAWLVPALPTAGISEAGSFPTNDLALRSSRLDERLVADVGAASALRDSPDEAGRGPFGEASTEAFLAGRPLDSAGEITLGRAAVARADTGAGAGTGFWPVAISATYACALAAFVFRFLVGVVRAARLTRSAHPIPAERLGVSADESRALARVHVFECPSVRVPVTVGWMRPKILLPAPWRAWSKAKCRSVLAHELAHVARGDCLVTFLAQLNRCLYWFHPLSWFLCSRLARLAEQSCDDAVIAATGDRPQYARHLLEVAGALAGTRGRLTRAGSVPMARRSNVETRITAILDAKRPLAGGVGRLGTAALVAVLVPTVLLAAALRPGSQEASGAAEESAQASPEPGDARDESPPTPPEAPARPDAASDVKVIRGTVVDESGNPVAGANVWYPAKSIPGRVTRRTLHAESDGQGRFEFEYPAAWLAEPSPTVLFWMIWAHKPGRSIGTCSAYKALRSEQGAPEVEIVLGPPTDASFVVVDPDGEPVAGAVVEPLHYKVTGYYLIPPELAPFLRTTTDANGRAALPATARDRLHTVNVTSEEFGEQCLVIYGAQTVPSEQRIPLRPVGRIEGRVVADHPETARGVTIHLITDRYDDQLKAGYIEGRAKVVTDEEGRFSVPAMAAGKFNGLAWWDKSLPFRPRMPVGLELMAGQTMPVEVRILPAVLVKGTVRTQDTKEPIAGVEISIRYGTYRQGGHVTSDAEGKFSTYVLPGYVRMHALYIPDELVQFPGSQDDRHEVPADVEQFELPPLELLRCKTVTGRLIDREGRPVAGASVAAIREAPQSGWICAAGETDEQGRFTMTHFPQSVAIEEVYCRVTLADKTTFEAYRVQRDPLVFQPPTSETGTVLEGRVVDQHGLPVPGAKVLPTCWVGRRERPPAPPGKGLPTSRVGDRREALPAPPARALPTSGVGGGSHSIRHGKSVLTMTTDAQGRFQAPIPVKRGRWYGLQVSLDDVFQRALGRRPWIKATGKTISFGDVTVERRWCLRGTVRNEAGEPVAGAKVTRRSGADTTTHVTDAEGRFVVPGYFAYGVFVFSVTAPGYEDFKGNARLESEVDREDGGVELVLWSKATSAEP